jgi:hypothetical protein
MIPAEPNRIRNAASNGVFLANVIDLFAVDLI